MSDAAERVLRAWIDCWSAHDIDGLSEYVAPGYAHHMMGGRDGDIDAFTSGFAAVVGAFPDITYTVSHVIHEADLVAAYLTGSGHHEGEFFGLAPTGTLTTFRGAYHCRLAGEKIVEDWDVFDLLTPIMTLGGRISSARTPGTGELP
jgi:predicted ester cyclase